MYICECIYCSFCVKTIMITDFGGETALALKGQQDIAKMQTYTTIHRP